MGRDLDQVSVRSVKTFLCGRQAKTKIERGDRKC